MRKLIVLISGFVMALPLTMALAQTPPNTSPSSGADQSGGTMNEGMQNHSQNMMMAQPPGGMMQHCMMSPMGKQMTSHSQGAFFKIQKGNTSMTIKCAENESMHACVSAAGALMHEMHVLKPGSPTQ